MLPNLNAPEFSLELPSSGEIIYYRPFLVKEEKILLMALEGGNKMDVNNAIYQVLKNCITTEINILELPFFDIEYIFVNIRAKSIDNIIKLKVGHKDKSKCEFMAEYDLNINDVKVSEKRSDPKIMLTDTTGVFMKYPSLHSLDTLVEGNSDIDNLFAAIASCIDYVFDAETVYEDSTDADKLQFVENLNKSQFEKVVSFFKDVPTIEYDLKYVCPSCNKEENIAMRGMQNFFV